MGDKHDDNSHGFTADETGVWPDTTGTGNGNTTGDPTKDFDGLSWKQIEAAVLGGGSMEHGQDNLDKAYGNVNWQSLQDAAGIFQETQQNLAMVAQALKDQTAALAGPDGPWKGEAATNFKTMMTTFATKFSDLADRIADDGGSHNVPTQLVNSAAYLKWAQDTIRYIDRFYAAQVIARGKQLDDGRAYISQFPDAVEMMTNDMRKVAGQLAQQYHSVTVNEGQTTPPPPPNTDQPDPPPPPPPPPDPPPAPTPPPPPPVTPPPPAPPPPTPPPTSPPPPTPEPPPVTPPPGGSDGPGAPPPLNNAELPPPPGGSGGGPGGSDVPPPLNNAEIPPPPGGVDGPGGNGTPPPLNNAVIPPPPGGSNGPGGNNGPGNNKLQSPDLPPPPDGSTGGSPTPPPLSPAPIPPPPGSTGGGPNGSTGNNNLKSPPLSPPPGNSLGNNLTSPQIPPPPGSSGGLGNNPGGSGNLTSPQIPPPPGDSGLGGNSDLANNALNPAHLPPGLTPPGDQTPGGGGMPMMPPGGMGGAGGMNSPSSERPDSSGLLGNIKQPWVSPPPEGIGNPNANGEAPPLSSANWAPPPGASGGLGDGPGGLGDGLGGTGGTGGPDAIKGLGESDLPKMPDPIGEQNQNNQQQQQTPGAGTPPMMPPGGMGGAGGMNAPSAERPDSSGLLGNVDKPWLSEIPGGVGDPTSQGETPPLSSAEWAPPPGGAVDPGGVGSGPGDSIGDGFKGIGESDGPKLPDPIGSQNENQQQLPQTPGAGTPPMMPPGGMGGAGGMNAPSAERPDSAGLLGNVDRPWLSEMPGGVGDPTSQGETPRSESAGWAPPPGGTGGDSVGFTGIGETDGPKLPDPIGEQNENNQQQLPQQPGSGTPPMMPPGGMGGAGGMNQSSAERPDAAGLLGGVQQPWTASTPGSVGDPNAFGDTPSSESAAWASPPNGETTSAELPDAIGADQQQTPGTPMVPPGGMGGAGAQNQSSAERPDSAGLLGGVQQPWVAGTVDGVGAPSAHGETPPLQAASWADSSAVDTHSEQGTTSEAAGVDQQSPTNTGWGTSPQPGWGTAGEPRREERAAPPAVPQGGGEADDIVRIAVVQPVDAEDTSAWDVGTAEFLPGLLPVGRVAEDRAEEIGTDYLERSAEPWRTEPAAEPEPVLSTYQRLRGGSAEILFDDIPMCGDGPEPEPEPSEKDASSAGDGDEAEEEEERTMADLLRQDDSAWGAPGGRRSSGVLE